MSGKWQNDILNGQARVTHTDQQGHRTDYCGEVLNGVFSGEGAAMLHDAIYIGQFERGLFNAEGMHIDSHNSTYHGQWCNGKRHGTGTRSSQDGEFIHAFRSAVTCHWDLNFHWLQVCDTKVNGCKM